MKLLIVGNCTRNLVIFRAGVIREALQRGWTVECVGPERDPLVEERLGLLGSSLTVIPFSRTSTNPFADFGFCLRIWRHIGQRKPNCILSFTHKPNMYCSVASFGCGIPVVMLIEGLGYAFVGGAGLRQAIARFVLRCGYRVAVKVGASAIFLNRDDVAEFERGGIHFQDQNQHIVGGVGVDLERFRYVKRSSGGCLRFLMVARLLRAKGTLEYIETAVRLSRRHDNVEFVLVGAPDPGSDSIDFSIVEGAVVSGALRYFPFTDDIVQHYINCDVYVLPSYREGMPVTIMEAMAVGRPIITSDVPGCREMVDGNGWLVHPANVQALEECCELVCSSREKLEALGLLSRSLAEKRFDVKFLSRRQVDIIEMSSRLR